MKIVLAGGSDLGLDGEPAPVVVREPETFAPNPARSTRFSSRR